MQAINTDYIKSTMNRATPGESLTNDPATPLPAEKPPQFTTVKDATEFLFEKLTDEENYMQFMEVIIQGTPLMDVAKMLTFSGFNEGKWNPDLMMLLIEPTVYILMALCERADIEFTIDGSVGEEEDLDENSAEYEILRKLQEAKRTSTIPLPPEMQQQIEALPLPDEGPPVEEPLEEPLMEEPVAAPSLLSREQ
tara:strand:- start:1977 stop:2561 length:585 start_codon:yes stop_codon:yes gene_type:complete